MAQDMAIRANLGCGPIFIDGPEWINLDHSPQHASVRQANLLEPLPIGTNSCEVVYSSHFLEHIPRAHVPSFLSECFRILKPGGVLRLVLPDFEEMCREYLLQRERGKHEQADFVIIEIIDQCIRLESGGELGKLYQSYQQEPDLHQDMRAYLRERNGESFTAIAMNPSSHCPQRSKILRRFHSVFSRLRMGVQNRWFHWLISQLPKAFVQQNVSFAGIGERHHWLWDYYQLKNGLEASGFTACAKCTHNQSKIPDFPFFPLDVDGDGYPRKGKESMFVEAVKPC